MAPILPSPIQAGPPEPPDLLTIGLGFAQITVLAFGGVLPWARFVIVERRRWLSPEEFTDTLALSQLLPGPNIVNLAVAVGSRFAGASGALAALAGLLVLPVAIVLGLVVLYGRFSTVPAVNSALAGMAAAAAGLVIAMALKIAEPILRSRFWRAAPFMAVTFVAVALFRVPLLAAIVALAPFAILAATFRR